MQILILTKYELNTIKSLIEYLQMEYQSASCLEFLQKAAFYASDFPRRVRLFYKNLKYNEFDRGISVVRGFPVGNNIGPTPPSWNYQSSYTPTLDVDYFSVLLSSFVGDVFGWETQQKGKIIHDLLPAKNKESAQTGYGSTVELVMHTEDSFHKYRGEYLCFYCMRNPDAIGTTLASIRDLDISTKMKNILFEHRFSIKPDESHLDQEQVKSHVSQHYINELCDDNKKVPLLYGNLEYPYICFDPFYTLDLKSDPEAQAALKHLTSEVSKHTEILALKPGDICILDNRKIVHGRRPFQPKYDGTDRWLKRLNISANLRHSADSRVTLDSRIIGESKTSESISAGY